MNRKAELLSPAGSYEGLIGAISAGADAIYLGGTQYSARAYAENFDQESLVRSLNLAHLFNRRIYLTLNTLVKEKEFKDLYAYLCPLYEAGLDGVIIQDFGVLHWLNANFPDLPIHASTQMNITHAYGAEFLKRHGVSRLIPARELSLNELSKIRSKVNIELETFVHGALCYSYSGRCLFSSILGGRSGNRGRCAQPCRLPYKQSASDPEWYPLSLKDMCTIHILPELIEAGIASFKIEGRMKKPEYTAKVTAIYRKYIDLYDAEGREGYWVSDQDREILESLYIRSEVGEGYYLQNNHASMITPCKPSYQENDDSLLKSIREDYIEGKLTKLVNGKIKLIPGKEAELNIECDDCIVRIKGSFVQEAQNQPLLTESVNKQLRKTGSTHYSFDRLDIRMPDKAFIAVKELNELRRIGLQKLELELLKPYQRNSPDLSNGQETKFSAKHLSTIPFSDAKVMVNKDVKLHVRVTTGEQWEIIRQQNVSRIYRNIDMWHHDSEEKDRKKSGEWYAALPPIFRCPDFDLSDYETILNHLSCDGVLIGNIESYEWLRAIAFKKPIVFDSSIYIWNRAALKFWQNQGAIEFYLPQELNVHEISELITGSSHLFSLCIYGRIPMMYSANCLIKQSGNQFSLLTDRYHKQFPVYHDCRRCYNIIYNSVPLSLHDFMQDNKRPEIKTYRLDFTNETEDETKQIFKYFDELMTYKASKIPYQDYTTGHIKRGVF